MTSHEKRKHSSFSASGAERWMNCPGSVSLSRGLPDKTSKWAEEGTVAHEVLETYLKSFISECGIGVSGADKAMDRHGFDTASFIYNIHRKLSRSDILVETRVRLTFIHPEMFGTLDAAVVDHFGTLHVFDYKYGQGKMVSARKNLQMIFYGIGLAHQYGWDFKRVRLWIIQPRVKGYDGPTYWDISIDELRSYVNHFLKGVERVLKHPIQYKEGQWCWWCKAKTICPLKQAEKKQRVLSAFT